MTKSSQEFWMYALAFGQLCLGNVLLLYQVVTTQANS
ncbi:MAG: hypothetical protein ACJAUZ_000868, partial [Flavobacteriaceae bacterium]